MYTANVGTSFLLVFFVTELPIDIFPEKSCHTHRKREEVDHCCTAAVVQCQLFSVQIPAIIRENVYWKLCFPVLDQSHLQCAGPAISTLLTKYYGKNDFHFCKLQSRYISMSETCNPYYKSGIFLGKSLHLPESFSLFET